MFDNKRIDEFKNKFGLGYMKDKMILEVLTTSKYETQESNQIKIGEPNRALAIVGDAFIKTVLASKLYVESNNAEEITKKKAEIECDGNLAKITVEKGMFEYSLSLVDGKYEKTRVSSIKVKATLFEALIGAIYISVQSRKSKNITHVTNFIEKYVL